VTVVLTDSSAFDSFFMIPTQDHRVGVREVDFPGARRVDCTPAFVTIAATENRAVIKTQQNMESTKGRSFLQGPF